MHTKHHQPPLQQTPALPQFASVASADVSVYTQISKVRSLVSWIFSHQKIKIPWKMPECWLWAPLTLRQQPKCGQVRHRQLITHCRLSCWAQNLVHTLTACASMPVQSFCLGHIIQSQSCRNPRHAVPLAQPAPFCQHIEPRDKTYALATPGLGYRV